MILRGFQLAGCVALVGCLVGIRAFGEEKINTIVIFTDDHGFADLACQDIRKDIRTPHIDALAAGGVRMTSGYVSAPQCVPSRAGLLSGRSQNRFGVESNGMSLDGFNAQETIAERLKKAGYATGMTGKWHLGPTQEITSHGFDDIYYKNSNRPGYANFNLDGTDREPGPEKDGLYHLDANSKAACAFIQRHHEEPFFFYCAYRAPHVPLDAPNKYLKRFPGEMPERRRQALAMISAIDDGVGEIVATLKEKNILERTMIWIIGDNGAPLKIHKADLPGGGPGWDGSLNEPLNGEKGMLSEGGIRVPFLVSWPGGIPGGRDYPHPVISLDVASTAIALANLPEDPKLDGVNLVPYLQEDSKAKPHKALYWRWIAQAATREGKWKYLRGGRREYLFDLNLDREEKHNVIHEHPEVAKRLSANLERWSQDLQPPGLATKTMSTTWEDYYDFYLEGKPAPPLRKKPQSLETRSQKQKTQRIKGWVARNGSLKQTDSGVATSTNGKKNLFIATAGLKLPKNTVVIADLRTDVPDKVRVQWRTESQKDFAAAQVTQKDVQPSQELKSYELPISATESVIHLRLYLPAKCELRSIRIVNSSGQSLESWEFD